MRLPDNVFGPFRLLGYQFSPRLADLPDQQLWRLTVPGTPRADYGPMNAVARNNLSFERIRAHWPDMLRVAGSLHTGTVAGYNLLRMLGRDGNPTPLGAAFAEYGRAAKTLHLMARKIFHGSRGEIRHREPRRPIGPNRRALAVPHRRRVVENSLHRRISRSPS